jgi:hypothetical protein
MVASTRNLMVSPREFFLEFGEGIALKTFFLLIIIWPYKLVIKVNSKI